MQGTVALDGEDASDLSVELFRAKTSKKNKSNTVGGIVTKVKVKLLKSGKLRIAVKAKGIAKPTGKVCVKFGKLTKIHKLKAKVKGKLTLSIPAKVKPGKVKVKVTYKGNAKIAKRAAMALTITVKR